MDPALLTDERFWIDPAPVDADGIPDLPELAGHVLFETSGSSGEPKQVAISKQALLVSAAAVNAHLHVSARSSWGLALPLHHVGGFGVAARSYQAECGFHVFGRRWDPVEFCRWAGETGISHTSLVPTQVHDLVKAAQRAPACLVAVVVGGGQLDAAAGQAARDLGWPVLASYGMTEASSQIATQPLDSLDAIYQPSPIPLLPIWNAATGDDGRLKISGPALFSGYLSGGRFQAREASWHVTSDRARLDGNLLTILGRLDGLIKVLGELVNPEEIENELVKISGGRLAREAFAVAAIPDERAGHTLVPVFENTVSPSVMRETLATYKENSPGFRRLAAPVRITALPRGELGKLRRVALAAAAQQESAG